MAQKLNKVGCDRREFEGFVINEIGAEEKATVAVEKVTFV